MQQHRFHVLTLVATAAAVLAAAACGSSGNGSSNNGGGNTAGPVSGHSDTITGVGSSATSGGGGGGGGGNPYSTAPSVRSRSAAEPYFFTPTPDTVAVGATVTFAFQDVNHTVTFSADSNPGNVANISSIAAGGVANADSTRVFSTAGVYMFHCSIHPYMVGVIVVH
jgi:plastocyanin